MNTANYEGFKKIELDVTKKLFEYIYTNIDFHTIVEELDSEYSYFYETENNMAFNVWLSLDYVDENGKTFTEKFLEDTSEKLTKKERKILEERKKSYVSLFKIVSFEGDKVHIRDILRKKDFLLLEPNLFNVMEEGEYVFSRIGKILNNYSFIGDINYLPKSSRYDFIKAMLLDFNLTRKTFTDLTIKDYLKKFGLNLYKIYDEIVSTLSDFDESLSSYNLDGSESFSNFESYLGLTMEEEEIQRHLGNLSNIVNFYLYDNNSLRVNLKKIDIGGFFDLAIDQGLISLRRELLSYIKSIKLYFSFLYKRDERYKDSYMEICKISDSPFEYLKDIYSHNINFDIDDSFSSFLGPSLNNKALDLLEDFNLFLLYIEANRIRLTEKNKNIKRKDLLKLNSQLENATDPKSKAPNQKDFINIDLFYRLTRELELVDIYAREMLLNERALNYIFLEEDEKYSLIFTSILKVISKDKGQKLKENLFPKLSGMNPLKNYDRDDFFQGDRDVFSKDYHFLNLLGLINLKDDSISLTSFGKRIITYLNYYRDSSNKKVIYLRDL